MSSIPSAYFKKYDIPGPRYTSYPTVPFWEKVPSVEQWISSISDALRSEPGKTVGSALYLHIPFCQSLCTYCGCNTRITRNRSVGAPYVQTLHDELKLYLQALGLSRIPVAEIHLGGGTPTFLAPEELTHLMRGLFSMIEVKKDAEFSLEVDPRVTTDAHLAALRELGFRRISMGVQDFDPRVQDIVHRIQSVEQVRRLTESSREMGFQSVNYDLIYGLPLQSRSSIESTIREVKSLRPDRIAFYSYAHVPWIKPGQRRFTEADLPSGDDKRALYELGREMLEEAGYREIGMDHFALESDSLWKAAQEGTLHRNFMGYTSRQVAPLFGLGVSAIGDSWRAFAQNEKLVETYQERVRKAEIPTHRGHLLDEEDLVLRRHILNLMTRFETDWDKPESLTEHLSFLPEKLSELQADGLVELEPRRCRVTSTGRAFIRNICMAFDARLSRRSTNQTLFSKTV